MTNKFTVSNLMATYYDPDDGDICMVFDVDGVEFKFYGKAPEDSFSDYNYFDRQENIDKFMAEAKSCTED